jgi:prepilin-type N-terminal cleavage/methylation domain-containing protein
MSAHKRGYTLLELIVAVSLISVFSLVGVVNFQSGARRQKVETATARLRQVYISAKSNALSGKKNCQACGASAVSNFACGTGDLPLLGWEVRLNSVTSGGSTTWQVVNEGVCGTNVDPYPAPPTPAPTRFTMDNLAARPEPLSGVNVTITGNASIIMFRPGGGGLYPFLAPNATPYRIQVTDTFGNSRSFTIDGAGVIGPVLNP